MSEINLIELGNKIISICGDNNFENFDAEDFIIDSVKYAIKTVDYTYNSRDDIRTTIYQLGLGRNNSFYDVIPGTEFELFFKQIDYKYRFSKLKMANKKEETIKRTKWLQY